MYVAISSVKPNNIGRLDNLSMTMSAQQSQHNNLSATISQNNIGLTLSA